MLHPGLYEQIINQALQEELTTVSDARKQVEKIDQAEASKILAQYLADVIKQGLDNVVDRGGELDAQVQLVNRIVEQIKVQTGEQDFSGMAVTQETAQLLALLAESDPRIALGHTAKKEERPETSIAQSSLFTGAKHEPQMFSELKKEIRSADKIEFLVSFIKWQGIRLLMDELREFTQAGKPLRIITTSYIGATDPKAIEELRQLPNTEIKISYDTLPTRLHAKAYVFYRKSGFTTAYVGSSNWSKQALSDGLEWNVKLTAKDQPDTIEKIKATFDSYWQAPEFELYQEGDKERFKKAIKSERFIGTNSQKSFVFEVRPYAFQQQILDKLQAERDIRKHYKNLVVSATGTGKTVISAFDYRRFARNNPQKKNRLLFVAHRAEILKQSLETFQGILKDQNFGQLFVANYRPETSDDYDHLFVSIQTLNSQKLHEKLPADYYDYIVVDEFHHAAAPTYQELLEYFKPQILLGLTATPERMDGKSVLDYFDGRIAAEIRLPEAIERNLLCPFHYFGVADTVDLSNLRWVRGAYDKTELSNLLSLDRSVALKRADYIVQSVEKYVTEMDSVKGLGFCVSVEHANFMADYFNELGIPSIALTGQSADEERNTAQRRLVSGELRFIFAVDIYNEGVDIPEVNTVLFLRPTESLTIFLQQLGRGLRTSEGKACLTVLDFIGQANKKYSYEEKFAALLSNTKHSVQQEIKNGFISAPRGCYIQLEKKAAKHVLDNIKSSFGNRAAFVRRIESFEEDSGLELNLENFLDYYHLQPLSIYETDSFSRLCVMAEVREDYGEAIEEPLTRAFKRFTSIDSRRWIAFLLRVLPQLKDLDYAALTPLENRMLQMFYVTLWGETAESWTSADVEENLRSLVDSPIMLAELIELLKYNFNKIDFVDEPVDLGFDSPLDLHCTYTRDQLLVALDFMNPNSVREGVRFLPDKNIDVFFVTLNKSDKDYSPSAMYMDYSINESLFHWQSQSTTSDSSPTGQRYIKHREKATRVLLFVREFKKEKSVTAPYTFLGLANYVEHEGSRPMNIIWRLERPIPAKFIKKTNKLMVG